MSDDFTYLAHLRHPASRETLTVRPARAEGSVLRDLPHLVRVPGGFVRTASAAAASALVSVDTRGGGSLLAYDGWLHNEHELRTRRPFAADGAASASAPSGADTPALLHSWLSTDGLDVLSLLVGEWNILAVDQHAKRIVLATDFLGHRPLWYFGRGADDLIVSNALEVMVAYLKATRTLTLDDTYIASYIAGGSHAATPFVGLDVAPAGSALIFEPSAPHGRVQRLWGPPSAVTRSPSESDAAADLAQLLREAVRARTASAGTIWCELSGGLDSSTLACLARDLHGSERALRTVTFYPPRSPESDERHLARQVAKAIGSESLELPVDADAYLPRTDSPYPDYDVPAHHACAAAMARSGDSVILSGRFGDTIMGNTLPYARALASRLATGDLLRFVREARQWAFAVDRTIYDVAFSALKERWMATATPRRPPAASLLGSRLRAVDLRPAPDARASDSHHPLWRSIRFYQTRQLLPVRSHHKGMYRSYPYSHRPLVDYILGLDYSLVRSPWEARRLMKLAFRGLVPPVILSRVSKGYAAPSHYRKFVPYAACLRRRLGDLEAIAAGYIDAGELGRPLEMFERRHHPQVDLLARVWLFENWLRAHVGRPSLKADLSVTCRGTSETTTKGGERSGLRKAVS